MRTAWRAGLATWLLFCAGCMAAHTQSTVLGDYVQTLPRLLRPLDPSTVAVGDFSVSAAIELPPEFADVQASGLSTLAAEHIRQELGASADLQMLFDAQSARNAAMRVVGEVTRLELTGEIDDAGNIERQGANGSAAGQMHEVRREFVLEVNFRMMRADGTAVAAGTGQSMSTIPILGSYELEGSAKETDGKVSRRFEGKVSKNSLAVAFRTAANDGAVRLLNNIRERQKPIAVIP